MNMGGLSMKTASSRCSYQRSHGGSRCEVTRLRERLSLLSRRWAVDRSANVLEVTDTTVARRYVLFATVHDMAPFQTYHGRETVGRGGDELGGRGRPSTSFERVG
jgi:hypothetical protein